MEREKIVNIYHDGEPLGIYENVAKACNVVAGQTIHDLNDFMSIFEIQTKYGLEILKEERDEQKDKDIL